MTILESAQLSPMEVRKKIEDYLLVNMPRLHKQKMKCGELQSYLDATTQAVMQNAQNLISRGMFAAEAWKLAVHQEIARTENQ